MNRATPEVPLKTSAIDATCGWPFLIRLAGPGRPRDGLPKCGGPHAPSVATLGGEKSPAAGRRFIPAVPDGLRYGATRCHPYRLSGVPKAALCP
jgi:hypothetical protein